MKKGVMQGVKFEGSKIMFLCTTDSMAWQFFIPHMRDLVSYGAKVDCVCARTGFWFDDLEKFGINMIEVEMKRKPINLTNYRAYKTLKKLVKENKYDIMYCQQPTGGFLGRFVGKKMKMPVIYTAHGFFFFKGNRHRIRNLIFKFAEWYMAHFTDILITINDEDYQACKKWKAGKIYKINGIGLDLEKYKYLSSGEGGVKEELGITTDKVIVSIAEFIPRKNYDTMIDAIAKLAKERDDFTYVMCGTGVLFEEMKEKTKKLGIYDRVRFLGYRRDIDRILSVSDIIFHQSFHEGYTIALQEAMAFGLAIVTSNVRGNREHVVEGEGGFITETLDVNGQVSALRKLLDDEELLKKMGKFNKDRSKMFYLDGVREQLKEIYKENNLI